MRIKPSKKMIVILGAVAVVLLGGCVFAYWNRASKLHVLQAEISKKQERLADSEQIARRLSQVEMQYHQAQTDLSILEKGVSTRAYVPTLLRQVEHLGKQMNLRVDGVRPKAVQPPPAPAPEPEGEAAKSGKKGEAKPVAEKKPDPYDKLEIDLQVSGKYWDVVGFVEAVTRFPKIIAVNDVQIAPVAEPTDLASPVLSVRLNTSAFILKETPPAAKEASDARQAATGSPRS